MDSKYRPARRYYIRILLIDLFCCHSTVSVCPIHLWSVLFIMCVILTYKVVVRVLDGRECEYTYEWYRGGDWRERRDGRNQLQHQQAQEVEVR